MIVSIKAARAAVVAALFLVVGPAQALDQDMPASCKNNELQRCSLEVWPRDSFAKKDTTKSVTFSNGATLICTSTGADKPRKCKLIPSEQSSGDTEAAGLPQQCADLKDQQHDLEERQVSLQNTAGREREYFARVMQMTPAELDYAIQEQQATRLYYNNTISPKSPDYTLQTYMMDQRLNFLRDLRASKALGPELGTPTKQMQARANKIVKNERTVVNGQQDEVSRQLHQVEFQISKLHCDQVPSVNQSVDAPKSGR